MTKNLIFGILTLMTTATAISSANGAVATKPISIKCEGARDFFEIFATIDEMTVTGSGETLEAKARRVELTLIQRDEKQYDIVPGVSTSLLEGENVTSVPYKGRKYEGHVKFDLSKGFKASGEELESVDLVVDPEYTVEKTVPQKNHWDPTWTWDVEVRRHSAVVPLHIDDHHGDYVPLDCFSTAIVNEKRPRR